MKKGMNGFDQSQALFPRRSKEPRPFEPVAGSQRLHRMQGQGPCPESRGGALWPSEVLKAKRPEGFDTLYWVLPVETGALRGNESNSAKEISSPTNEKEVTTHRNSKAAGIPSQWPCGKARRLQPQAQRPQLRREERGEHRRGANPAEPVLGLCKRPAHP